MLHTILQTFSSLCTCVLSHGIDSIIAIQTILQEIDIRCKQECVPIVYDARYNIEGRKAQLELLPQSIQLNKPAQVFSKIKGQLVYQPNNPLKCFM